jgi:hypothetical protein
MGLSGAGDGDLELRGGALLASRSGSTALRPWVKPASRRGRGRVGEIAFLLGHANLVRWDFVNGPSNMHSRRFTTATRRQVRFPRLRSRRRQGNRLSPALVGEENGEGGEGQPVH